MTTSNMIETAYLLRMIHAFIMYSKHIKRRDILVVVITEISKIVLKRWIDGEIKRWKGDEMKR